MKISLLVGKMIPDRVDIDDARLTQILVNIIGNAVKFTPENGSVKVRARFIPENLGEAGSLTTSVIGGASNKRGD
jgi:signal transduction histidine kinase